MEFDGGPWADWASENWLVPMMAVGLYVAVIDNVPRLLSEKYSPPNLDREFAMWNLLLSVFSAWGVLCTMPVLLNHWWNGGVAALACVSTPTRGHVGRALVLFALSKIVELLDTAWLLVRKRTPSKLHTVHHATACLVTWKLFSSRSPLGLCLASLNYTVHAPLYLYFGLTQLSPGTRALVTRFAPYITQMQLVQFVCGLGLALRALAASPLDCAGPRADAWLIVGMYILYLWLFGSFWWTRKPRVKRA